MKNYYNDIEMYMYMSEYCALMIILTCIQHIDDHAYMLTWCRSKDQRK